MQDLKRKSVRGGAVSMASQGISIAIQLASTVVLARLLSPNDYGIMAMVVAVTGFASLFRDLGLSSAAIQKKDLSDAQQSNLFWLNVIMGSLLTIIVALASPAVAWFYKKPELAPVTLALSVSFVIVALGTQHGADLVRSMKFTRRAVATIAGALVTLGVSVGFALHGYSYWSLVWGTLSGSVITTALLFKLSAFTPGRPTRRSGIGDMLKFGANVTGFDLVNYFHRNLDNILIGRFWGPDSLGLYSRAYQLLMFPIQTIRGPINAVAFPALSRLQDQPAAYRAYYRRVTAIVAFLSMPLCAFLFAVTKPAIELALGKQWIGVVPIFAVLALTGFIQPVASLRGLVMLSTQRGKAYFSWGVFNAVAVSVGFVCGIPWGAIGIAISYAVINYLILYPSLVLAFKDTPLQKGDFFRPLFRPAFASIFSAAVVVTVNRAVGDEAFGALGLVAISFTIFAISYIGIFFVLPGGAAELRQFGALGQQLKRKK
jgi:PST family polysaccharide transporter